MSAAPRGSFEWRAKRPVLVSAIVLDACGAQTRQAVPVDRRLPDEELLDRKPVALAGLFEAQQATANGTDHLSLAPGDPAYGVGRRKVGHRDHIAVRPDNISDARLRLLAHEVLVIHPR